MNKAEPGLDFKLTPPWDLLNTINLHNFMFELDITNFRVGFRYDDLNFSFPLASLDRVEVWYSPATRSRNKSVDLSLFGSFLGVDFTKRARADLGRAQPAGAVRTGAGNEGTSTWNTSGSASTSRCATPPA